MIATRDQLKAALGIAADDASKDVLLDNSLVQANALITSYVGFDLSDTTTVREWVYTNDRYEQPRNFIHLPEFPVLDIVEILDADGVPVPPANYRLIPRLGRVDFLFGGMPSSDYLTLHYHAGFDPLPADLLPVALNIASTIYNNGGQVVAPTNQLKSLTMFDAMSMSFNTGDVNVAGPDALLRAWAFVLDRYSVINKAIVK